MPEREPFVRNDDARKAEGITEVQRQEALIRDGGVVERSSLASANFWIIATDERGIIQLFNVGAERCLATRPLK